MLLLSCLLPFYSVREPSPQQGCRCSGWVFAPQLNQCGESLTDTPGDVFFTMILDSGKSAFKIVTAYLLSQLYGCPTRTEGNSPPWIEENSPPIEGNSPTWIEGNSPPPHRRKCPTRINQNSPTGIDGNAPTRIDGNSSTEVEGNDSRES